MVADLKSISFYTDKQKLSKKKSHVITVPSDAESVSYIIHTPNDGDIVGHFFINNISSQYYVWDPIDIVENDLRKEFVEKYIEDFQDEISIIDIQDGNHKISLFFE